MSNELTIEQKNKLEEIRKEFEKIENPERIENLKNGMEIFKKNYLKDGKLFLTLENYTNLKEKEENYFLNFLERKTKPKPGFGSSNYLGLYMNGEGTYNYKDKQIGKEEAEEKFQIIKTMWKTIYETIEKEEELGGEFKKIVEDFSGKQMITKFIIFLKPESFLPILSKDVLDKINEDFKICDEKLFYKKFQKISNFFYSYFKTTEEKNKIYSYLWEKFNPDKNLKKENTQINKQEETKKKYE
jgi:hypothetical protein